ncbi:hypothetical protein, partial [Streptomyces sp. NPDC056785]|uniref:hypothetical protein n=1 Tax=Streptomyces sp. NPDC056785 TaxID=3345944 RepID=UPI00369F15AE
MGEPHQGAQAGAEAARVDRSGAAVPVGDAAVGGGAAVTGAAPGEPPARETSAASTPVRGSG